MKTRSRNKIRQMNAAIATIVLGLTLSGHLCAQIEIILRKSFIDSIKNRVTIDADFTIDMAHANPNPLSKDGDLHIAGRDEWIGLPIVAEIMNAKPETAGMDLVHKNEGTGNAVSMTGVWRIWCEHAGNDEQLQGATLEPFETTNPAHVFEIHPITKIQNVDLVKSLRPINGYTYKNVGDAFERYTNAPCRIEYDPETQMVTLETKGVGYNYVRFKIELLEKPKNATGGGKWVNCNVLNDDGEVLVEKVRMIFAEGSEPEKEVQAMKAGDTMDVLGIPRINLVTVSKRAEKKKPQTGNLPFEMIIVGTF